MNRKTAEWLISNNFFYLENGKSIFNALAILTAEGKKLGDTFYRGKL
jgi:hypothetical protein